MELLTVLLTVLVTVLLTNCFATRAPSLWLHTPC